MVLSILERMNPADCFGGRLSLIYENPSGNDNDKLQQLVTRVDVNDRDEMEEGEEDPNATIIRSLQRTVPDLLECIAHASASISSVEGTDCCTSALQTLHDLTTKECEQNRVPLICNAIAEPWDVVDVLSTALLVSVLNESNTKGGGARKQSVDENRRLILWTLNNLSIPYENKVTMALGKNSLKLFHALTKIIELNLPEAYLCCIFLLNITFSASVIRTVTMYVPPPSNSSHYLLPLPSRTLDVESKLRLARSQTLPCGDENISVNIKHNPAVPSRVRSLDISDRSPSFVGKKNKYILPAATDWNDSMSNALGNSSSLIRVVEQMMLANTPFLFTHVRSVQGEAIRWSCGFVRNITHSTDTSSGVKKDTTNGIDNGKVDGNVICTPTKQKGTLPQNKCENKEIEDENICILLSQTEIPRLMIQYIKDSPRPIIEWTKDSVEDLCLGSICNMAQWQSTRVALWRAGAYQSLKKLEEYPGIHGYRARAIRCSLGVLQSRFR